MLGQPVIFCFAAVALGIGLAEGTALPSPVLGGGLVVALMLLWLALRRERGIALSALIVLAAAGGWAASLRQAPMPSRALCDDPSGVWRVRVAGPPQRLARPPSPDDPSWRKGSVLRRLATVELLAERCAASWQGRRGRVRLGLEGGLPLGRGDILELRLLLRPFGPQRNPHEQDPAQWARRQRLTARASARSSHAIVERGTGVLARIDRLRDRVGQRLERLLPPERAALAKALALGDRASVAPDDRQRWADAGMAHLIAISGLHVGMVGALFYGCLSFLIGWLGGAAERFSVRRVAAVATLPPLLGYCLWTGAPESAQRATVMAVAFLAGIALGRRQTAVNAFGAAGVLLLLADPTSLWDPSFLLSFCAVAALLLMPPRRSVRSTIGKVGRVVVLSLLASAAATVATAPITAHFFGRVALAAPLSNLFAVPLATWIATPLALVFACMVAVGAPLQAFVARGLDAAVLGLDRTARWVSDLPWSAVDVPALSPWELALYGAGCAAVLLAWRRRGQPRWLVAAVAVGLVALTSAVVWRSWVPAWRGHLRVVMPYVGQGDATILLLPGGGAALVDAGGATRSTGPDPGRRVVAATLRRLGVRRLDLLVVTHPHPDHVNGAVYVAEHFPVAQMWWNGMGGEMASMARILAGVRAGGGRVRRVSELPPQVEIQGARIEVLHPRPDAWPDGHSRLSGLDVNDNSVVLRFVYGDRSVLLSGDIGQRAEAMLAPGLSATDVLKSPHHGSRFSSSEAFLKAVGPGLVLISCGENNPFGVPHSAALERYAREGAQVLRTDRDGLLEVWTDGRHWHARAWRWGSVAVRRSAPPRR